MTFDQRVNTLSADLKTRVAGSPGCPVFPPTTQRPCTRNFLVYADGLYAGDWTTGVATRRTDATPGASNASNRGGQFAYVLGDGSADFGISAATTAEHELLHNLGAVQDSAPHSTRAGHCFDENDVMCYPDGGAFGTPSSMVSLCPAALASTIDCGQDDYFKATGTLLDGTGQPAWNVYDSLFLCPAEACVAGATGGPQASSVGEAPATSSSPAPAPAPAPAPRPAPAPTVRPTGQAAARPADPLAALTSKVQARLGALLAGRPLRIGLTTDADGTFTARLMLGGRAVAAASTRVRAGRTVVATLRLSRAARRKLSRSRARLRVRLAFTR
jgi:hypothetical protein